MCWIIFILPICIFMSFFTLKALSFEPVKFMDYTAKEFYEYKNSGLCAVVRRSEYFLRTLYIVIGTILGLVLDAFMYTSYIKVVTGIGGVIVVVGTVLAVVVVFILLEKLLKIIHSV